MPGYVSLPAYRAPTAFDFTGLNTGIDEYNKKLERNRLLEQSKEIGASLFPAGTAPAITDPTTQNPLMAPQIVPASPAQASAAAAGRIIGAESGGDPNASNPNSSATGAGQFISSTWLDTVKRNRPDLASGKSDAEILSLRSNPNLSREMTGAYAAQNSKLLQGAGFASTPGNTYLAHFAGPGGASAVLRADPSTPVTQILSPASVAANPHIANMTAGDLRSWADRKMGGAPATSASGALAPVAAMQSPGLSQGIDYRAGAAKAAQQGNLTLAVELLGKQQEQAKSLREEQTFQDTRHKVLAERIGGIAQTIAAEPDPIKQKAMVDRLLASDPRIPAGLKQYGVPLDDPASITKYLIAEAQGFQKPKLTEVAPGATLYNENSLKPVFTAPNKPDAASIPSGYRVGVDGKSLEFIPGGPADPATKAGRDKFNESQLTSSNFANMMVTANQKLEAMSPKDALGKRLTDASGNSVPMENPKNFFGAVRDGVVPFEGARNYITPNDTQKYNQNAAQWIRAKLRKESGAAIGQDEMEQEFRTYFPQYGDGPDLIKQKADSRAEATKGMIAQAGGAYEHYFVNGGDRPATPATKPHQVSQPANMPEGARKAPDGNWYVEQNGQFFRVDP